MTRKYPLRGYILGVLTHTTAWDRLWGGDILFKLSEFQKASQTTAMRSNDKLCMYNLKNITSTESVPSSCVRQHT